MTAHVEVPHGGPGTHTLMVALPVDDVTLADPGNDRRVVGEVARLAAAALAGRRAQMSGGSGPAAHHGDPTSGEGCGAEAMSELPGRRAVPGAPPVTKSCELCDRPALGGGLYCADHFTTEIVDRSRSRTESRTPTRLLERTAS